MSGLGTVLIAAVTSAVVSLGVEWLAKPSLEARKERILERHRGRREFHRGVDTIMIAAERVQYGADGVAEDDRMLGTIKATVELWSQPETAVADSFRWPTRSLVDRYVEASRKTMSADHHSTLDKLYVITKTLTPALRDAMYTPRWRIIKRLKARREVKQHSNTFGR